VSGRCSAFTWYGLAVALAVYLGLQLAALLRVLRWLATRRTGTRAGNRRSLGGIWWAMIVRLYRRKQFHKQRLLRLLA